MTVITAIGIAEIVANTEARKVAGGVISCAASRSSVIRLSAVKSLIHVNECIGLETGNEP